MCWNDIKSYLKYYGAIFFILILSALVSLKFLPLFNLDDIIKTHTVTDIIAITTASALAFGVLTYIGNSAVIKIKYSHAEFRFGFKEYTISAGLLFLLVPAVIYYYLIKKDFSVSIILFYITLMGALAFFLGLTIWFKPDDNERVTLKIINCTMPRRDLELYQITSTDYRFKDLNNGKELIIPIGQIQEIESQN